MNDDRKNKPQFTAVAHPAPPSKSPSATRLARGEEHSHDHHSHDHHGHGHTHGHAHGPAGAISNLKIALLVNATFALIEVFGAIWTGSVAVLSDAVHDLGDTVALCLAYVLERLAQRKSSGRFSYGFRRLSLFSAVLTAAFLLTASTAVLIHAIPRLLHPTPVHLDGMIGLALLGIAANGYAAFRLQSGATMNERIVSWHMVEDVLGWVAVLVGAVVMKFVDIPILDPLLAVGFTLFIFWRVLGSLRETLNLFLQASPENFDLSDFINEIRSMAGVLATHDAHLWTLDGQSHVLTLHVVVDATLDFTDWALIKRDIRNLAMARGHLHVTVEMESATEAANCPSIACVGDIDLVHD